MADHTNFLSPPQPSADSPSGTRPGTPASFASTAPTSVFPDSEADSESCPSPLPITHDTPSSQPLAENSVTPLILFTQSSESLPTGCAAPDLEVTECSLVSPLPISPHSGARILEVSHESMQAADDGSPSTRADSPSTCLPSPQSEVQTPDGQDKPVQAFNDESLSLTGPKPPSLTRPASAPPRISYPQPEVQATDQAKPALVVNDKLPSATIPDSPSPIFPSAQSGAQTPDDPDKPVRVDDDEDNGEANDNNNDNNDDASQSLTRPNSPPPRSPSPKPPPIPPQPDYKNPFPWSPSKAKQEWEHRKSKYGEENEVIDELMCYEGLEEVKQQFLDIKSKVNVCESQGRDLKKERFNIIFQGNPGTGKTTIARLYARFLNSVGVLASDYCKETSGIKLAAKGVAGTKRIIKKILSGADGGVLFVDEAYQLTAPYMDGLGRRALDVILTSMENHIGDLVVIFVGYKDEMESFHEHNPGLASRIPYTMNFADFTDAELWKILYDNIHNQYKGKMKIDGEMIGLNMRVAIRRLSQMRGCRGFGNARAVQTLLAKISTRQAKRLTKEKNEGAIDQDCFLFTMEDIIGPDPSKVARECPAAAELEKLIGLTAVKDCVKSMIRMIRVNYNRELKELKPLTFSLNQLFVGNPGTGKTTVAKLYGQILCDLGLLSKGDVVLKNPADFIGECLGKSEAKTRKILEATIGKVLVIDEAYMLDAGDPHKEQDKFKTGVIDTLVALVQGAPGEDRCIILVGYEDKISNMFHNVNPGLSRRFPIERPFRFDNFDLPQLEKILDLKMKQQDISCTPRALEVARDVLERALMRPNFTNAGEVESCLAIAKMNYEMRQSQKEIEDQAVDGKLEPEDFDIDYDRGSSTGVDRRKALEGLVAKSIIDKLLSYQIRCVGARKNKLNPRDQVPTNFIFKGFPGTGKTTAAQQMGQIFYEMGFLSTAEVVECSATDLMAQYVGQTAPKTQRQLEKGLGKVLFIDEAYRLIYGQYAAEALDELIQFLTHPSHVGKMVVILAGYTADMHLLMSMRPVLSGLFPEEIVFENLQPEDCISLLHRELEQNAIVTESDFLCDVTSQGYLKVKRLFNLMRIIPSWSNARDVKYLAKQMLGKFLESLGQETQETRTLSVNQVVDCMIETITLRRDRCISPGMNGNVSLPVQPPLGGNTQGPALTAPQLAQPPPASDTDICTPGAGSNCGAGGNLRTDTGQGIASNQIHTQQGAPNSNIPSGSGDQICVRTGDPDIERENGEGSHRHAVTRERHATKAEWNEVQKAKSSERERREELNQLRRDLIAAENALANGDGDDNPGLTAQRDSLKAQVSDFEKSLQDQEKMLQRVQAMNRCVNGYCYHRVNGGYRCDGGMHFVSDSEIRDG